MPVPLTVVQNQEQVDSEALTPQEADEQSFTGHMPDPDAINSESTLDRAQKMGLYTEGTAENPEPLNLAQEVAEQSVARHKQKVSMQEEKTTGYTQTSTIALIALIGVIMLAIGLAVRMAMDNDTDMESTSPSPTVQGTSPFPTSIAEPSASPTDDQTDATTTPSESEAELARIVNDPDTYMNQNVTVTGEVNTVYTDRAFLIDGPGLINDTFLVVSSTTFDQDTFENNKITMDEKITVTGRVQRFNRIELGNSLGVLLPDNQYGRFEDNAYILVERVEVE